MYLHIFVKKRQMKFNQINLSLLILAIVLFSACSTGAKKEAGTEQAAEAAETIDATAYSVDADSSIVEWKGEVAGVYGHNGVISIQEGSFSAIGDSITSGEIVIDMTTIVPTDSASYNEENTAEKLVGHLSTGDFFLVDSFPTATFKVKSSMADKLIGDLTIRGNTNEETVELTSLEVTEEGLMGSGVLVFDRQKYDVNWAHYVKDYILSDEIEIKISVVAK